uniref:Cullin family profile domain-containing protein n=1 Tax=Panagrolaimus sp. PS1159 TaxID=55785 RepID=A0AC35GVI0_9BILA
MLYYKQHFAKRLIFDKSSSNGAEKFVISRLKIESGVDFTQKIEAMLKDIETSKTLTKSFKDINVDGNFIDFSVKVLTKGFWPISNIPSCILPFSAETAFTKFKEFYLSKHSGPTFYKINEDQTIREETKILTVTTFQMCILMKFNEYEFFTVEELLNAIKIPEEHLKRALASMSIGKESQKVLLRNGNELEIG